MTQEEKQLLLKDLCARFPYGVNIRVYYEEIAGSGYFDETVWVVDNDEPFHVNDRRIEDIKPYLRPLSSMTEEEKKDILQSLNIHGDIDNEGNLLLGVECNMFTLKVCKKYLGELNKRMFDVCHMIEKGLALEAPEGMY